MKRLLVALTMMGAMLVVASGAVLALNSIDCPNRSGNLCVGTDRGDDMEGTVEADDMRGRAGGDTLRAFAGNDKLAGNVGNDVLIGFRGGDRISGGPGTDLLSGRQGNDRLIGGSDGDPDEFFCGPGEDTAIVELGDLVQSEDDGLVEVTLQTTANDLELITTCENIRIRLLQ